MSHVTPLTVKQFASKHVAFTEPSLRALIFKAQPAKSSRGDIIPGNGLAEAGAIIKVGRKVLIDEARFFSWLDAQRLTAA